MNINNNKIFDNQYFANINYYKILLKNDTIDLCSNTKYQKGWNSNKCSVVGPNGSIHLSVPIDGGRNQDILYKDVKIAYTQNWQQQHYRTLLSCYGNSPYFNYYKNEIEEIYKLKFEKLFDFNLHILKMVLRLLKSDIEICITEEFVTGQEIIFSKKHIASNLHLNTNTIQYPQVFEDKLGFTPNLSILDLLFCMGPQAKKILI